MDRAKREQFICVTCGTPFMGRLSERKRGHALNCGYACSFLYRTKDHKPLIKYQDMAEIEAAMRPRREPCVLDQNK